MKHYPKSAKTYRVMGLNYHEIGLLLGVSRQRAQQLCNPKPPRPPKPSLSKVPDRSYKQSQPPIDEWEDREGNHHPPAIKLAKLVIPKVVRINGTWPKPEDVKYYL